MEEIMLKIENVSKQYKLGQIGGTTLRDELQRRRAKLRGEEDPTKKIGAKDYNKGETFMALDGVSFEVKKGEAVGIIGHNGAGKSTLLKLISRVTAPTGGTIGMNGRVASMLEVGTGFHPELTGRENVYMNGAILGMTKKEIDAKMEDIIEFSEVRQFIDTPVKRYSSGMYVKLAFSVAAHLDSEIMIMDEVLAVGDMAFQKKCLTKMREVASKEGRTVLYVSHNMNTIRQLCDRVIVLDHGKVVFDGDVEEGIGVYMGLYDVDRINYTFPQEFHTDHRSSDRFVINTINIIGKKSAQYVIGELVRFKMSCYSKESFESVMYRCVITYEDGTKTGTMFSSREMNYQKIGKYSHVFLIDTSHMMPGKYCIDVIAFQQDMLGTESVIDAVHPGIFIEILDTRNEKYSITWLSQYWGSVRLHDFTVDFDEE